MEKRKVVFGTYDTNEKGAWTVARLDLTSPTFQTNLVQVPGRNGSLDLSAILTDGEPVYGDRQLTVVLENSDGDRASREQLIRELFSQLDGRQMYIQLPDDTNNRLYGRLRVAKNYNDLAHASVTVTAVCEPWLYGPETARTVSLTSTSRNTTITNSGRSIIVPTFVVSSRASISVNGRVWSLSAGTHKLASVVVKPGASLTLSCSGSGTLGINYREAVLL